ncbi:MAG: sigma-54 interaction domain-containing protein [Myxococcota bacterium]
MFERRNVTSRKEWSREEECAREPSSHGLGPAAPEGSAGVPRAVSDEGLVGDSRVMRETLQLLDTVARSDCTAIIHGESGTGKELACRLVHAHSARRGAPFVAINCAAFPETLLESELFGHRRGAFTGAVKGRPGRFRAANGGTLMLDEIGEMPAYAQVKLLRVVETGLVEPLGADEPQPVDVRVIAATHRSLGELVESGRFRLDLYYRLKVFEVRMPALRERREDIPQLVEHFARRLLGPGRPLPEVHPDVWETLGAYHFPGNVRELLHAVEHALVLADGGPLLMDHLPGEVVRDARRPRDRADGEDQPIATLGEAAKRFERAHLLRALRNTSGRRTEAARLLGISRKTLWAKLREHELSDVRFGGVHH